MAYDSLVGLGHGAVGGGEILEPWFANEAQYSVSYGLFKGTVENMSKYCAFKYSMTKSVWGGNFSAIIPKIFSHISAHALLAILALVPYLAVHCEHSL